MFDGTPKEVFSHCRELEAIGLAAPQVTYIIEELRARGAAIEGTITTVEEAKNAILAFLGRQEKI